VSRLGYAIGGILVLGVAGLVSIMDVHYEPASAPPTPRVQRLAAPAAPQPARRPGELVVPVQGYARAELDDSWGDPRSGGRGHRGIDLMAREGTPVVATADGVVEKLFDSRLGGTTLYLRSADRRWTYYYAHLSAYAPGMREGLLVRAGQVLGYVGDTGDAGEGNHHLHFSVSRMEPGQRWWQGADVNPYPLLAEAGGRR
jgi:murein DD-endopeptidase MepM/ murein hydrolase activator NlpD